jgi:hypothetical protein
MNRIVKAWGTIRNAPERRNGENTLGNGESKDGEIYRENRENYSSLTLSNGWLSLWTTVQIRVAEPQ